MAPGDQIKPGPPPLPSRQRSADALNAVLPRKALAAEAGRGLQHWGRPEPIGRGGSGGRQPPGKERPSCPALTSCLEGLFAQRVSLPVRR